MKPIEFEKKYNCYNYGEHPHYKGKEIKQDINKKIVFLHIKMKKDFLLHKKEKRISQKAVLKTLKINLSKENTHYQIIKSII